ncbi:MAG TPA: preprotein translocase subunit SecG [Candidatus Dormibacteraeota bacterium]|nr:preprotein translocase subunit SecG [Candidatus Dormibacteraeota bacterium]
MPAVFFLAQAATALPKAAATLLPKALATPLQTVPAVPLPYVKPPFNVAHPFLAHSLGGIFVVLALVMVVLMAVQTTKNEGLGIGSIGGQRESLYRGRLGRDEQLARITTYVAIGFVAIGFIISLTGI